MKNVEFSWHRIKLIVSGGLTIIGWVKVMRLPPDNWYWMLLWPSTFGLMIVLLSLSDTPRTVGRSTTNYNNNKYDF